MKKLPRLTFVLIITLSLLMGISSCTVKIGNYRVKAGRKRAATSFNKGGSRPNAKRPKVKSSQQKNTYKRVWKSGGGR